MRCCAIICTLAAFHLTPPLAEAQVASKTAEEEVRTDTPSGFPVPRFVSLKNPKTFCRSGPSFKHPIKITYLRAGLPVKVVAETTDHWRKIKDHDEKECWAHQTTLQAVSHVIVETGVDLRQRPDHESRVRAYLEPGVIGEIERSASGWLRISVGNVRGWAPTTDLWGADH